MAEKSSSIWIRIIIILIVAGAAFGGWRWYSQRPKEGAPEYRTAQVARGDIVQSVTANGQLSPVKSVQVGSQVSGIIREITVDFNSHVKANEVLAKIDPDTAEQNLTQSQADLANAKAQLELAEVNDKRNQQLRKSDLISVSEADQTQALFHQAQAVYQMREAEVKKSKVDLERTTIYSPIDGVVISRNVDVGQTVASSFNTPTLFLIANDLTKMQIEAMVSEADVGGVDVNQRVTFQVDAFPGRDFHGEVKQVRFAPTTNQNVVTYTTVVEVNNPDLKLRPGMTATASIITAQRNNVLKVPNSAFRFRPIETPAASPGANKPLASGTNQMAKASSGGGGAAASGGSGEEGGAKPNREEWRRRMESMSPEERAAFREKMKAQGGRRGDSAANTTRTIYVLGKTNSFTGKEIDSAVPVTVKVGITDNKETEILDGLKEGDSIIIGLKNPPPSATAIPQGSSPFGGGFGRGGRR